MKNLVFRIRFLAIFGPFCAHNRPSGGHGWPRLCSLIKSAASMGHFDAKNLEFLAFFRSIFLYFFEVFSQSPPISAHTCSARPLLACPITAPLAVVIGSSDPPARYRKTSKTTAKQARRAQTRLIRTRRGEIDSRASFWHVQKESSYSHPWVAIATHWWL